MMHPYRCDSCGCYLDPGEGHVCDECQETGSRAQGLQELRAGYHPLNGWVAV